jgi:glycerol kinase
MSSRSSVVQARSGIPIATYFSAVKLRWLLDYQDNEAAHGEGHLMAGEAPAMQVLPTNPILQAQWTPG